MVKRSFFSVIMALMLVLLISFSVTYAAKSSKFDRWKPKFDPSSAKFKCVVATVGHPGMRSAFTGYAIRDELWKLTKGQIYFDYKPLSVLGGEVETLNMLKMGAIQGMAASGVASTNLGPRFGAINLPFLVNSFDKLDKFVNSGQIYKHYMNAMAHIGIMGLDITTYGSYGWATTIPVKTVADARKVKFRIAEATVNKLIYHSWGLNPVVMPWPDVPTALARGVITGLDHTAIVCYITKKFEVAKYFTQVNYAPGVFIWIFNEAWFKSLPPNLQKIFIEVVHRACAQSRKESRQMEIDCIQGAKTKAGVTFYRLPESGMAKLKSESNVVHQKYAPEINKLYSSDTYRPKDFLKQIQELMGYKP